MGGWPATKRKSEEFEKKDRGPSGRVFDYDAGAGKTGKGGKTLN